MRVMHALYNCLLPVAAAGVRLLAPFNAKIAEGLAGRRGFRARWSSIASAIDRNVPLLWFHVSSVGEFEQAKPVIEELSRTLSNRVSVVLTFFSPSGMNYYRTFDRSRKFPTVKHIDYLPVDSVSNMRFCLDELRPDMIVYVKFDLWPNLIVEAHRRGIPQVLVSGTLSPGSGRLMGPLRAFYAHLYAMLSAIASISDEDAVRFRAGRGRNAEIVTAGDTRFDQVCRRVDTSSVAPPAVLASSGRAYIIAGSTWPRDEEIVIPAFAALHHRFPEVRFIIVPHEPTESRLRQIDDSLDGHFLPRKLLSQLGGQECPEPVIVADGIGYLAELYRVGKIAYIGGSFTTGVHNVMEPAVLGLPVFFGPRIDNSYEARGLVEIGSGTIVRTANELADGIAALLGDPALLERSGTAASRFIRNRCGAAGKCVSLILKHLKRKGTT